MPRVKYVARFRVLTGHPTTLNVSSHQEQTFRQPEIGSFLGQLTARSGHRTSYFFLSKWKMVSVVYSPSLKFEYTARR